MTWHGIQLHRRPPTPGGPTWSSRGDLLALWRGAGGDWWAADQLRWPVRVGHGSTMREAIDACYEELA